MIKGFVFVLLIRKNFWPSFHFIHFFQVRTLFVSGLPMDAKPRELYLLFRAYEGYEGSLLKVTSKNGKTASVNKVQFIKNHNKVWFHKLILIAGRICHIQYESWSWSSKTGFTGKKISISALHSQYKSYTNLTPISFQPIFITPNMSLINYFILILLCLCLISIKSKFHMSLEWMKYWAFSIW